MSQTTVDVFFYGLFMDTALLGTKAIAPTSVAAGHVDGYRLRIGRRATLVHEPGSRAHGMLMTIGQDQAAALYADESVSDYVPEPVSVALPNGEVTTAVCYNLPPDKLEGTNAAYAEALLALAAELGFPQGYLDEIRAQGSAA